MTETERTHHNKVNVLSVYFDNVSMTDMTHDINQFFNQPHDENLFIVTANPEIIDYATMHPDYLRLINRANYVVPDGTGIVLASKILRTPLQTRVPGIELMEACLSLANERHQRVYLLGAKQEIVREAQNRLSQRFPNVTFASHHGYIDVEDDQIAQDIQQFNPYYLFVGMGYPKQEQWIERFQSHFSQTVCIGIGGAIEVFSGAKKRAPKLFQRLNIEWIYRVLIDWKRLNRLQSIPRFLVKVMKQKLRRS
ncbi:N-acetylglucosaminyldiphosphoundecaprenol N-acetyl-beta-D-mannosaminyltransferase TarA [Staphylococcus auricularis]|uniref:N-acetylglucosaminyldiphosphoundecaprenol N-acetyl-beta-D-mannosaminyltransferase TarA n=1 Tax=Staphylococcus auricularis TaxID=29379 RepID=UPI001932E0FD|nr:N-acetylglucosaminyldiphosphoundecaprenol N-acetyl-beta-D-mannosaminyltransferase TarA [Staphylococcus auricularis]MBM0868652.1 glycosyltransferase [Staphylococcus auricularis]